MEIQRLSDEGLLENIKLMARQERELLTEILKHLAEVDRRHLHLEIGYPSLWAYCTQELKYSEAAAQRRIEAMRALRDLPVLEPKMAEGRLSLSNVAKAQSAFRKFNQVARATSAKLIDEPKKLELILELENKSQREADQIIAKHFPEQAIPNEKVRSLNSETSEIKLVVSKELLAKIEKAKALLSHKNPCAKLSEVIELMTDFVIAKKDLARPAMGAPPQRRLAEHKDPRDGRRIAMSVRRQVWRDAEGKCEYTEPRTGKRCEGVHQLEIDHARPKALGGGNTRENLRLYCRAHNQLVARQATLM